MVSTSAIGIIQARMASARLPGKVLAPIADRTTLLDVLVQRLMLSEVEWWLATTDQPSDDVTASWGDALGLRVFRGSTDDVLSRFDGILHHVDTTWCVRVTADNPFVGASTVREMLATAADAAPSVDLVRAPRAPGWAPLGFVPEVVRTDAIRRLNAVLPDAYSPHRVHVTSAIREESTADFQSSGAPSRPHWRWTVDTLPDLEMARQAFELFGRNWRTIAYPEMVQILDPHPEVTALNALVTQKRPEDG